MKRRAPDASPIAEEELRGEPHSVVICPSVKGSVHLIAFDGCGEPMVEWIVPRTRFTHQTVESLRRWVRDNDTTRPLTLVR